MVKYLGSKRALVPVIEAVVDRLPVTTAADLFTGTTRVAQALRRAGVVVHANDLATYSEVLGGAYVAAGEELDRPALRELLRDLAALPGTDGYVTATFARRARFLQEHNARRIDAIREAIDAWPVDPALRPLALTSLLEAADRVDSTCGVQMAYVKAWSRRSHRDLDLREPHAVPGPPGRVTRADAREVVRSGALDATDLAYLDPPYNRHSYFSNYHVWETLVRWDAPPHYGVACKREDCRTTKSPFNSRRRAWDALSELVDALPTPWVLTSFSDEGFHRPEAIVERLAATGRAVGVLAVDTPRYVGARIGIHSPAGERVGTVSHLRNRELLFLAGPDRAVIDAALAAGAAASATAPAPRASLQAQVSRSPAG